MRLLVVSNLYPPVVRGGYEVECRDVVDHLRREHDVTVLASTLGARDAPAEPHVRRLLPWTGDHRRADSALALLHARRAVGLVREQLAEVRPEAVYVWNAAGLPAATLRALQLSGLPLLVRVCEHWFAGIYRHDPLTRYLPGGARPPGTPMRAPEAAWAAVLRRAQRPVLGLDWTTPLPAAVCWNSAYMEAAAPAPDGVEVVHRDVVIPSNARTEGLDLIPRDPEPGRVLFVGRLDERKGAAVLVRALGLLRGRGVAARLRLVGPGDAAERQALEELARACGVADRVELRGSLWGEELREEISRAAVWCVPSVWDEPAPLTCTEAALCRVPAVLSRVGGIPDMFLEGEQALFHDRGDHVGCAEAIARSLAGGPEVARRVERALARGHELAFGPYVEAMDRFLVEGTDALRASGSAPTAAPLP